MFSIMNRSKLSTLSIYMSKICACGPRAKNGVTGVALAFDLLAEGLRDKNIKYFIVDATRGVVVAKSGSFSLRRAWDTVCVILSVWRHLLRCNIYYATMSTSSVGFVRDYLTVGFAKLLGRKTLLHLHGGGFEDFYLDSKPWLRRLIRANLRRTDIIIVLGEILKEQFYCAGKFVKPKLVVIPNGLTLGVDEPKVHLKKLPSDDRIELLYLSSLMPSKGFFDVLEAMRLLEIKNPGRYHLNLCGSFVNATTERVIDVYDEKTLQSYLSIHYLKDCVTIHGQVKGDEKQRQFNNAHIFLLPTSYPWEGQPLSIIEALAFAIPVISCYHKGIPELIKDGKTGCFVDARSPEALAGAVCSLSRDDTRYKAMSEQAREHYVQNFKREVHLDRLIGAIQD